MKEDVNIKEKNEIHTKVIFILIAITLMIPSITYMLSGKGIFEIFSDFSYFYTPMGMEITNIKLIGTILFALIFTALFVMYIYIIKHTKELFKTDKSMLKYILIIAIIFTIILPMTSTDIYYYIGTGWSEAKYKVNPYYTSVEEVLNNQEQNGETQDMMLMKTPDVWKGQTVVYGPLWPVVCRILSGLSFGNMDLALVIYKLFNIILHLINCYLIYKITHKKKMFVLLYALNPAVLFNGLSNVHNDLFSIALILMALYFLKEKKNIVIPVILLALATAIKYYAILLVPFIVIYYYRKEKPLKRILYASILAVLFIAVVVGIYLIYARDIKLVLYGVLLQQAKYVNSIYSVITINFNSNVTDNVSKICTSIFIVIYLITILKLLFTKKISFTKNMRTYNNLLLIFMFFTITGFQSWYITWMFSTIMWQRGKMVNFILAITFAVEIAKTIFFLYREWYIFYEVYYILMLVTSLITAILLNYKKKGIKHEQIEG